MKTVEQMQIKMQARSKEAGMEDGLVDTVREGESGMSGESRTDVYTLPCVKQIASGKLLSSTGGSVRCSVMI